MTKALTEDLVLIQCERIVNETWSTITLHYDLLKDIIEKDGPRTEWEQKIVMIAANAALQKMTLDKAIDNKFCLEEMSKCGKNLKENCPCERDVCLTDQ